MFSHCLIYKLAKQIDKNGVKTYLQWDDSKVRKNTLVLFVLIVFSTQEAQVSKAVLKAELIGIPSFSELPTWKYQPLAEEHVSSNSRHSSRKV